MVWAGINTGELTDLHIIRNGNLTAQSFANKILRLHVVPYAAAIGDSFLLIQDNARNHTARLVKNFLEI
ncbi:hypothetical protein TNCV_882571 [Trichonephila clavipes]|nr:hypothetical protein TNCV_882571 [Trichonephila clavipes]